MAEFSVIKESEAPSPVRQPRSLAARMRLYEQYVADVAPGKVGKLTPSGGESLRAVALRVSRAAKRRGRTIQTWIADDAVYFSVR